MTPAIAEVWVAGTLRATGRRLAIEASRAPAEGRQPVILNQTTLLVGVLAFMTPVIQQCDWQPGPGPGDSKPLAIPEGDGDVCPDGEPEGNCRSCLRWNCCPEMKACEGDAACDCVVDCMSDPGGVAGCAANRCGVTDLAAALEPLRWGGCPIVEACTNDELRWGCPAPDLPALPELQLR